MKALNLFSDLGGSFFFTGTGTCQSILWKTLQLHDGQLISSEIEQRRILDTSVAIEISYYLTRDLPGDALVLLC